MTIFSLIERLEKAEGASRELDSLIAIAISPETTKPPWSNMAGQVARLCGDQHWRDYEAPHYTKSIDAARTLVPANHYWTVGGEYVRGDGEVEAPHARVTHFAANYSLADEVHAKTEAIALCIAALRARSAMTTEGSNG